MFWLLAYFVVASAGLIIVFAMFKVGSDADTAVTAAIRPDGNHVERADLVTSIVPASDPSSCASGKLAPDLPVVEAGSIDLCSPFAEDGGRGKVRRDPPLLFRCRAPLASETRRHRNAEHGGSRKSALGTRGIEPTYWFVYFSSMSGERRSSCAAPPVHFTLDAYRGNTLAHCSHAGRAGVCRKLPSAIG